MKVHRASAHLPIHQSHLDRLKRSNGFGIILGVHILGESPGRKRSIFLADPSEKKKYVDNHKAIVSRKAKRQICIVLCSKTYFVLDG